MEEGREGNLSSMAACFAALLRGEETAEAEAGLVTLADAVNELRALRRAMSTKAV